ncbi:hypothetical protein Rumeso_02915 [Rubellimicrobium mesophilum DSM 19309]|uniref:(S)-ureidoglycine aminohydrolase cupin domain-containing protein n=1 Tax=Rubellimicrobium mesophilum DSM 19309 TaxID=442562 RepID=A0A017HPA2_9RHOB|nr:cupin domain-containing protein [Rubellimicrobium mesophilum]EYD75569.1 hypothetical protein Rumeso_02915 [Rubellimicrobium mesophilum DSM 19309]
MIALPFRGLPKAEPLPAALLEPSGEAWQRGLRSVDRGDGAGGRVTAGSWQSGAFRTRTFTFGGHEWMWVLEGRVEIASDHGHWSIGPGGAGVVPAGLRCAWTQPVPVTKVFLRWDGELPGRPAAPWLSSDPDRGFGYAGREGMLVASARSASWVSPAREIRIAVHDSTAYLTNRPASPSES